MIVHVTDSADPRLDAFRWRDRQLANRLDRAEKVGAGLFVAEGDLVVERAIQASCTPSARRPTSMKRSSTLSTGG